MNIGSLAILILAVLSVTRISHGYPQEDEVISLPGLPSKPSWKHYSGYLNGTKGKHLHYWFIESESGKTKDPLVLWMNGGPGCSSDLGLLTEHGPFLVNQDGKTLRYNQYGWNTIANMLYLEAPAGVGFSYSDDKNYTTDDDQVSLDNYMAIKHFFKKFPELKSKDFYVTGESYGGIYVPTLSVRLVDDPEINFKGFAVGNGLSDYEMNDDSLIYFAYYHGLIGEDLWTELSKACCDGNMTRCSFDKNADQSLVCKSAVMNAVKIVYGGNLNIYNLYAKCVGNSGIWYDSDRKKMTYSWFPWQFHNNLIIQDDLKYIQQFTDKENHLRLTPPCVNYDYVIKYLNLPAVRNALHIPDQVQDWDMCSTVVSNGYKRIYMNMRSQYLKILGMKKRVLVYNGDIDMACNFLGDEWFTDSLDQKLVRQRKQWIVMDSDMNSQVVGFAKQFENLAVVTIKGAGHMVPTDKPHVALMMFNHFINDIPF